MDRAHAVATMCINGAAMPAVAHANVMPLASSSCRASSCHAVPCCSSSCHAHAMHAVPHTPATPSTPSPSSAPPPHRLTGRQT